jgi:3-phenylpropionate/trans-cinnamate dioxygenase ferredoxin subunit
MSLHRVMKTADIAKGEFRSIRVADETLLVAHTQNDEWFAVENRCSHDGGSFEQGGLNDCTLTCPRHGATFNVKNGQALTMPAVAPIETFAVTILDDGWVAIDVEDEE